MVGARRGLISIRIANLYAPWTEPEVLTRTPLDGPFDGFRAAWASRGRC